MTLLGQESHAMARPKDPRTARAIERIMAGECVREVAAAMQLDRAHLYRLLKAQGLKPPAHNKRGRKPNLALAPVQPP